MCDKNFEEVGSKYIATEINLPAQVICDSVDRKKFQYSKWYL